MSSFRSPVGPQPNKVYWRRRLLVALGVVAVIVIIILIVVRPGSTDPTVATSAAATPGSDTAETPEPVSTDPADTVECDISEVEVAPITDAGSYATDVNPVLSFSLTSRMNRPCTIAAGSDVQEFVITSGSDRIWDSKDCQEDPVAATTTLLPGVPKQSSTLTWERTRSSPDTCDTDNPQVDAGGATYRLDVTVGDLKSPSTTAFLLN